MSLKLKIPPPVIGLVCALIMWLISRVFDSFDFDFPSRKLIALGLFCLALSIDFLALLKFKSLKTTINPIKPEDSSSLVDSGVYKYTRNPMYLGLLIILFSWGLYLGNFISMLLLPIFVWYITVFQIIAEEEILENIFNEKYNQYKQKVRRWI